MFQFTSGQHECLRRGNRGQALLDRMTPEPLAGGAVARRHLDQAVAVDREGHVDLDLAGFSHIVPCGLSDVAMTSVAVELGGAAPDLGARARAAVRTAFARHLG